MERRDCLRDLIIREAREVDQRQVVVEAEDAVGVEAVVEDGGGDVSYNEEMKCNDIE